MQHQERKLQLLESRFGTPNITSPTQPNPNPQPEPRSSYDINGSNPESGPPTASSSNGTPSNCFVNADIQSEGQALIGSDDNSVSALGSGSKSGLMPETTKGHDPSDHRSNQNGSKKRVDHSAEFNNTRSPKQQRTTDDEGSRGAPIPPPSVNDKSFGSILKYFHVQNTSSHQSSSQPASQSISQALTGTIGSNTINNSGSNVVGLDSENDCVLIGVSSGTQSVPSRSQKSTSSSTQVKASSLNPPASHANAGSGSLAEKIASMTAAAQQSATVVQDLKKQLEGLRTAKDQVESKMGRLEADHRVLGDHYRQLEDRNQKLREALETVYRSMAMLEARRKRDQLAINSVRLGKITTMRTGPASMQEVWEEGYALSELNRRVEELSERKEDLEKRRKRVLTLKRAAKKGANEDDTDVEVDFDLIAESDAIRCQVEQLKRDESSLVEERRLLEAEKATHQRELKRCASEDKSRFFRELPCLHRRYMLISLLGKGGFSEVWKAMDLVEMREVAVKVHQLNNYWQEQKKQAYIRHVTREYTIQQELVHPRVVQLFEVFEIDDNSFATVLEYCRGADLDERLRRMKTIPEKDARTILLQIVSGLRYLSTPDYNVSTPAPTSQSSSSSSSAAASDLATNGNAAPGGSTVAGNGNAMEPEEGNGRMDPPIGIPYRRKAIIHFDLKPGNILFDEAGDVKITDFGLSKIVDESNDGTTLELTSQGAGTYWYLPPECFAKGEDGPPRISSKVDIWSLGVIYYQMLFGRRPFGEGKTQDRLLSEGIILNATQVHFPNDPKTPKVSDEAKEFIRLCLTPDQKQRPDVHMLCVHPYLRK